MTRRYARGKFAKGECARSGRILPLNKLVRDGLYPNLLVAPEWYEPPYFKRPAPDASDAVALYRPSPRRDAVPVAVEFPLYDVTTGESGGDLFEVLPCDGFDFATVILKLALYTKHPGNNYSTAGECTGAGYKPGGVAVEASTSNSVLSLSEALWPNTSVSARWGLLYDAGTGKGVLSIDFGCIQQSILAQFRVDFSNVTIVLTEDGGCVSTVYSPAIDYHPPPPGRLSFEMPDYFLIENGVMTRYTNLDEPVYSAAVGDFYDYYARSMEDGRVFLCLSDRNASKTRVFSIDASGNIVWSSDFGGDFDSAYSAHFLIEYGKIVCVLHNPGGSDGSETNPLRIKFCLDLDGNILWQRPGGMTSFRVSPDGTFCVGARGYGDQAKESLLTGEDLQVNAGDYDNAIIRGDRIYWTIDNYQTDDYELQVTDFDLNELEHYHFGTKATFPPDLTLIDDVIYLSDDDTFTPENTFVCFVTEGAPQRKDDLLQALSGLNYEGPHVAYSGFEDGVVKTTSVSLPSLEQDWVCGLYYSLLSYPCPQKFLGIASGYESAEAAAAGDTGYFWIYPDGSFSLRGEGFQESPFGSAGIGGVTLFLDERRNGINYNYDL